MHVLSRPGQRRAALIMVLLIGVAVLILSFGRSRVADVILLPEYTNLAPKGALGEHRIPRSWAWYWRTKEFILGNRQKVVIHAAIIHVAWPRRVPSSFSHAAAVILHTL